MLLSAENKFGQTAYLVLTYMHSKLLVEGEVDTRKDKEDKD